MAEIKKRDLTMVPFHLLIVRDGFNIRKDLGNIDELAASIRENGVKQPLRGYKEKGTDKFIVVNGHRRHAALSIIAEESSESIYVPMVLEPQKYSDEERIVDMFVMNEGKPLTPLEQAEGIRRLKNKEWSDKEIAAKISKSSVYVWKLNLLNTAPKKLKSLIESDKVSASLAMDIIAKGEEEVNKFLQNVADGKYDAPSENGQELFPPPKIKTKEKITAKDVRPINSFRTFKKVAKDIDDKELEDDKKRFFKFMCKLMNNELDEAAIKRFFK